MSSNRDPSTGRSSSRATARSPPSSTPGPTRTWHRTTTIAPTSTPSAGRWCARSATPAGSPTPWPAASTAAPPRRSTRARSAWRARRWRAAPASPTSRSRCRASARARSASPAPTSRRRTGCPRSRPATRSPRSRSPSPRPAPTSGRCAAPRAPRATPTCSTARRPGSATAASPTSTSSSRAPRRGPPKGAKGISAFIVEAGTPGFEIAARIDVIAPHPLARLRFTGCRVPKANRIGADGEGFKVAMRTLDVFRTSVAAAALGFARRALDEALHRTTTRPMFGQTPRPPAARPGQARGDGDDDRRAALLVYRAAWQRDKGAASRRKRRWPRWPLPKARSR